MCDVVFSSYLTPKNLSKYINGTSITFEQIRAILITIPFTALIIINANGKPTPYKLFLTNIKTVFNLKSFMLIIGRLHCHISPVLLF